MKKQKKIADPFTDYKDITRGKITFMGFSHDMVDAIEKEMINKLGKDKKKESKLSFLIILHT